MDNNKKIEGEKNRLIDVITMVLTGIGGVELPPADRCRVIGLEPGRMYNISRKNVCDRFDNSEMIKRLKGEA